MANGGRFDVSDIAAIAHDHANGDETLKVYIPGTGVVLVQAIMVDRDAKELIFGVVDGNGDMFVKAEGVVMN